MSETMRIEPNRGSPIQAFGLAVVIEAAIVLGAVAILVGNAAKPKISEPVPITIAEQPPVEKPPEPKPEPPPPEPQVKPKLVKLSEPKPQTPPQAPTPPLAQEPAPVAAVPTAFSEPAPPPVVPAPPPPAIGKVDAHLAYDAKVTAAVRQWHSAHYPAVASTMRFHGKAKIEFHLRDGVVSGEHVMTSCNIGLFDQAALQAVKNASYPETPEELRGHDNLYQVWVEFQG